MGKLGVLMIVAAVVLLVASILAPDILSPMAPLFCPPGQKLVNDKDYFAYGGSSGFSIDFSCTDGTKQIDVSGQVTLVMAGIFVFLLVGGIIVPLFRRTTAAVQPVTFGRPAAPINMNVSGDIPNTYSSGDPTNNPAVTDLLSGLQRGVIRFGGQEISLTDLKSGAYQQQMTGGQHTLADTLRQLEDAHKQGLINDDEYGHLRQDALTKLV